MAVLPTPGGSAGVWGTELNAWLLTSHNADGSIRADVFPALVPPAVYAGAYTLALTDAGKAVEITGAGAANLLVRPNATVAFPIGTVIEIFQAGTGQVTIVPDTGVTIRTSDGAMKLSGQYASASLRKRGTNEWVLVGNLVV